MGGFFTIGQPMKALTETTLVRSEAAFQAQVEQLARLMGWKLYHTHDSRHSAAGFPDLVLVRASRLLFVELKKDGKKPTPQQQEWLDALCRVHGVEVYCWHPSDWDAVVATLER